MSKNKKQLLIGGVILLFISGAFFYLYNENQQRGKNSIVQIDEKKEKNETLEIPKDIPKDAPNQKLEIKGSFKLDIAKISEVKLQKLNFTKETEGDTLIYHKVINDYYIEITEKANKFTHVLISEFDPKKDIPQGKEHAQYADVYDTNEVAVSDSKVKNGVLDYENLRRVMINPDGTFQYANYQPDQTTVSFFGKICEIINELSG